MSTTRPKQHHYVPRFYLERFADPEGHVWTFDKFTDKVFATSPSKLAREGGFYHAPALGTEIDQTAMEDMLSELEGEVSPIIARWLETLEECSPGTHAKAERAIRTVLADYLNAHPDSQPDARVRVARFSDKGRKVDIVGVAALVGARRSTAKARASRANGRLGGRPRKTEAARSRTKASL